VADERSRESVSKGFTFCPACGQSPEFERLVALERLLDKALALETEQLQAALAEEAAANRWLEAGREFLRESSVPFASDGRISRTSLSSGPPGMYSNESPSGKVGRVIRPFLKRSLMWSYNHGLLSESATQFLFRLFRLRSV